MSYYILDKTNITSYLYQIDTIKEYFENAQLSINEIGDGNLNFVFIIKSKVDSSKALILKQAVPYLRCVGEEFPLDKERMTYEIRALQTYLVNTPNNTPIIYHANEAMSVVVMQYLSEHIIMRKGLIASTIYENFAEHISDFLAQNLFKTSSLYLDSKAKRSLVDRFNSNTQLCKLTEDFVFTFAFMENETNDEYAQNHPLAQELFSNMNFKKAILKLKYKFMTQNDALLHGDLHTGSIMLNTKETYVIDPEFAFVGPFGFDIGALIGNLVMSYTSHIAKEGSCNYSDWILQTIQEILEKFETKFLQLWQEQKESALITEGFIDEEHLSSYQTDFMLNILQESIGFAGAKMARRMFGIAGVEEIREIQNFNIRDSAMKQTLQIANTFVTTYETIQSTNDIINIIKESN